MTALDLVIRGGRVATASDTFLCDVGIRGGKIVALGEDLGPAADVIDASGKLVLPGGIDSHVHLAQPSGPGIVMADDFETGTRSAAFGGNTIVLPFCYAGEGRVAAPGRHSSTTPRPTATATSTSPFTSSSPTRPSRCWARNCPRWSRTATPRSRCS